MDDREGRHRWRSADREGRYRRPAADREGRCGRRLADRRRRLRRRLRRSVDRGGRRWTRWSMDYRRRWWSVDCRDRRRWWWPARWRGEGQGRSRWSVDDRGAASVMAVAVGAVWFGLVVVGVHVGEAVVSRHRVSAAADLGALAAAGQLAGGVAHACGRAEWVVERMGGRLVECLVEGWEVSVHVSGEATVFGAPNARARAGPAEP